MGKGVKDLTIDYNLRNTNPAVLEATRNVIQYYQSQSANSIMARYKAKQKNVSLENIRVSVPNPFLPTTFDPYDRNHNIARTASFDNNMKDCFIEHGKGCQPTIDDIGFSRNNNKYVESFWLGLVQKEADDFTSLHNSVVDQQNIFNDIKKVANDTNKKKPTQNGLILCNKLDYLLGEESWVRTTAVHNKVYDTSRWTISMR
ncbi:MAG: hypothetical protein IK070_01260, partial [Clostridia bacterium]|nr:hypothetical protein [Clostridia bacterium]